MPHLPLKIRNCRRKTIAGTSLDSASPEFAKTGNKSLTYRGLAVLLILFCLTFLVTACQNDEELAGQSSDGSNTNAVGMPVGTSAGEVLEHMDSADSGEASEHMDLAVSGEASDHTNEADSEEASTLPEGRGDHRLRYDFDRTLEWKGVSYRERKNLTSILLLGIDKASNRDLTYEFRNGGQSDFMRLVVLDHDQQTIQQLAIDRDTMADMDVLGVLGQKAGHRKMQICLAHNFGEGREASCENAVRAVSRLLMDQPIDLYASLYLDGLPTMNDYVGGVEVTVKDDLTNKDPALYPGATVLLTGDQVESFVRSRMGVGEGTNEERMARQEEYLINFAPKFKDKIMHDENSAKDFLKVMDPYITTNAGQGRLINEGLKAKNYDIMTTLHIPGEHKVAKNGFVEYYPNEEELMDMVIELFFEPLS